MCGSAELLNLLMLHYLHKPQGTYNLLTGKDISNYGPPQSLSNIQGSCSLSSAGHLADNDDASCSSGYAPHEGLCCMRAA